MKASTHQPPRTSLRRSGRAYALDMDGLHLKLVRSESTFRGFTHRVVWEGTLPLGNEERQTLLGHLVILKEESARLVAAMPIAETLCRPLGAPFPSLRKALHVFPSLLDVQLPFPLDECRYAFYFSRVEGNQSRTVAFAALTAAIEKRIEMLRELGCEPHLLLHEGLALFAESLRRRPPGQDEERITCMVGLERTILISSRGRIFETAQSYSIGLGNMDARRWASQAARMARSLRQERQTSLHWLWCGPLAGQTALLATLEAGLADAGGVTYSSLADSADLAAEALAAAALSTTMPQHNFRTGPLAHPDMLLHERRAARSTIALTYLLGLFLLAASAFWMLWLKQRERTLDAHLVARVAEVAGVSVPAPRGQEALFAANIYNERQPALQTFLDAIEARPVHLYRSLTDIARERGILFSALSISAGECLLEGSATDWRDGELLEDALQRENYRTDLIRLEADASERIHFTLKGVRHD